MGFKEISIRYLRFYSEQWLFLHFPKLYFLPHGSLCLLVSPAGATGIPEELRRWEPPKISEVMGPGHPSLAAGASLWVGTRQGKPLCQLPGEPPR